MKIYSALVAFLLVVGLAPASSAQVMLNPGYMVKSTPLASTPSADSSERARMRVALLEVVSAEQTYHSANRRFTADWAEVPRPQLPQGGSILLTAGEGWLVAVAQLDGTSVEQVIVWDRENQSVFSSGSGEASTSRSRDSDPR